MKNPVAVCLVALALAAGASPVHGLPEDTEVSSPPDSSAAALPEFFEGTVLSTFDSGGYTYVQFDNGTEEIWAAGPTSQIEVGDRVQVQTNMIMEDFHSGTLGRTFEEIYFTMSFGDHVPTKGFHGETAPTPLPGTDPHASLLPSGHPELGSSAAVEIGVVARADGGHTLAELWSSQETLEGSEILVRGKVVKFVPGVLGRNWIHLQDGSGEAGGEDLTVTTDAVVQVGDLVLVKGQLARKRDFGAGYFYDLLVENATVTVE